LAGCHYFRFEFVRVSPPFAATQGGILVNSVHLSTYSLSEHDAPKAATSIQDAITGRLRKIEIETFHKILKSGCKAEDSKLRTADGLANLGVPSYKHVKALTERLLEQALAELDAPVQGELSLTQEHHLIRDGDDYADLFTLGAKHSAAMPSNHGDLS